MGLTADDRPTVDVATAKISERSYEYFLQVRCDPGAVAKFQVVSPSRQCTGDDGSTRNARYVLHGARSSGEQWVTWFYPPSIRDMVIEPSRWAQLDIKEMAALSTYVSVALYEICARYKDAPGGPRGSGILDASLTTRSRNQAAGVA